MDGRIRALYKLSILGDAEFVDNVEAIIAQWSLTNDELAHLLYLSIRSLHSLNRTVPSKLYDSCIALYQECNNHVRVREVHLMAGLDEELCDPVRFRHLQAVRPFYDTPTFETAYRNLASRTLNVHAGYV